MRATVITLLVIAAMTTIGLLVGHFNTTPNADAATTTVQQLDEAIDYVNDLYAEAIYFTQQLPR